MNATAAPVADVLTSEESAALPPDVRRIYQSPAFAQLRARRGRFGLVLTVLMCTIYYGFVLTVAFAPQLLATKIDEVITLGIPLGLGVIVSAIVLTAVYVYRANREFDRLAAEALEGANP